MDLATNVKSQQILNLQNYGDNDIDFARQSENLMKNGFLDTRSQEFGYYHVDYSTYRNQGGMAYWQAALVPILLDFVGFPTDSATFDLTAYLYIFDSSGNLVKRYEKRDSFYQVAGLYYGHNPTKKAARKFSALYEEIFQAATRESGEINQALEASGPITAENRALAMEKIASYFNSRNASRASSSSSYSSGTSSGSSSSGADVASALTEAFSSPLQSGSYGLSGSNANIHFTSIGRSGIISYTTAAGKAGTGSYTINGDSMTIQMEGYTFVYTINSRTMFSGNGETWVRTGF
jgi:hypothetical protein